jgi:hypothetical protein
VETWVNDELTRLVLGRTNLYRNLLSACDMGFVLGQRRWDTTNPRKWRLTSVVPIHPLTMAGMASAHKDAIEVNEDGSLKAACQFGEGGQAHPLDIEQLVYWPVSSVYLEDKYGVSSLESARRPWYIATALERFWSIWCERGAYSNVIAQVEKARGTDTAAGAVDVPNADLWAGMIRNSQPGEVIAFEVDDMSREAIKVINLLINEHAGEAFEMAIRFWQSEKYKALSYPVLLLEDPKHSSRAQVQTVLEDWLRSLESIAREMGEIIIDQIVVPMVFYNYGEQAAEDVRASGTYNWPKMADDDLEALAATWDTIQRSGKVRFTAADEESMRGLFSDSGIVASMEQADASAVEVPAGSTPAGPAAPSALSAAFEVTDRYAYLAAE